MVGALLAGLLAPPCPALATAETASVPVPGAATPVHPSDLLPVPAPDLATAEAAVRRALEHARADLDESLAREPPDPTALAEAFGKTGMLYQAHLILEPAEACYRNAAQLAPRDHRWRYYLGYLYQSRGRFDEAAEAYARALALRPEIAPARLRLGQVYLELARLAEAEPALRAASQTSGLEGAAAFALGRLAYARQDYPQAQRWLQAALAASPAASRVHYTLGLAYRAAGDLEQARNHLARRGDVEPPLPDPLIESMLALSTGQRMAFHEAMEAVYKGEYAEAARLFREGLTLDPDNPNARVSLARALYLSGERTAARAELDAVLAARPRHPLAALLLGALEEEDGVPDRAAGWYRTVLAAVPDHAGAHYLLANLLLRTGDPTQAAEHYAASLRGEPDNPYAQLRLALALLQSGAPDGQVLAALERARAGGAQTPEVTWLLAGLLAGSTDPGVRDGRRAQALAEDLWAQAPEPEHGEVLAMAYAEAGALERAVAVAARAADRARAQGRPELAARIDQRTAAFRNGEPAGRPWPGGPLDLRLPPASASALFSGYPAESPY